MIPKRATVPRWEPGERRALPAARPRLVYTRENGTGAGPQFNQPESILIVEDDFLVAMEAESALAAAGFAVIGVATTAEEAIAMAASGDPALVVMDIRLAGKRDGVDAALELFREHGIRCIFATAHDDAPARARAEPGNPLGWLPKPYSMLALVDMVRRSLDDLAKG